MTLLVIRYFLLGWVFFNEQVKGQALLGLQDLVHNEIKVIAGMKKMNVLLTFIVNVSILIISFLNWLLRSY